MALQNYLEGILPEDSSYENFSGASVEVTWHFLGLTVKPMYILVLLCPTSKSYDMNSNSKDIISQPSMAPFSEKKIPLESS